MRRLLMAVAVLFVMGAAGAALAQSKCDAGIDKAAAKKVGCICKGISKGSTLGDAITTCTPKFSAKCAKAKTKNDCAVQTGSCGNKETEADNCAASLCLASPSGAFLD